MTGDLAAWEDLLGPETCRLITAADVRCSPDAVAAQYNVRLFALGVHILTSALPAEAARLAAWGEEGLADHWVDVYAMPRDVALDQAGDSMWRGFGGLSLLQIYLMTRAKSVTAAAAAALAREGFAELARWRSHSEEPVKTQRRTRATLAAIKPIAGAGNLPAEERDTNALMAWHRLNDFDRGRIESEATGYGIRLRNGWLLQPGLAADAAQRIVARASEQKKPGRPGAIVELATALTSAQTELEIRNVWERGTVEAREAIEAEAGCRLADWYSGAIMPRELVKAAADLPGKRGQRPLYIRAHCEATICRHYLALTGRDTPDWWKWGGPYFDFLSAIDERYKTSLVQALNGK